LKEPLRTLEFAKEKAMEASHWTCKLLTMYHSTFSRACHY